MTQQQTLYADKRFQYLSESNEMENNKIWESEAKGKRKKW